MLTKRSLVALTNIISILLICAAFFSCERYYTNGVAMYFEGDSLYMKSEFFKDSNIIAFSIDVEKANGGFDRVFYIAPGKLHEFMIMIEDEKNSGIINVQKIFEYVNKKVTFDCGKYYFADINLGRNRYYIKFVKND